MTAPPVDPTEPGTDAALSGHDDAPSGGDHAASSAAPLGVVVVDDSVLLREGIVRLLAEHGFEVLAALGDAGALDSVVAAEEPDLVLLDVRMPPTYTDEGVHAAIRLRHDRPGTGVVLLSQAVEERYAAELVAADVTGLGYLLKDRVVDIDRFVDALRRVAAGGSAIDPEVVRQIVGRSRRRVELERLTPRELEVLQAMAEGRSNRGIAEQLVISQGAVEKHISNVFTKLDLPPEHHAHRRVMAVLLHLRG